MVFLIAAGLLYLAILIAALWLAFARGDHEVRRAAWITIVGVVATAIASWAGPRWTALDYGILAVDATMALFYGQIAMRTPRWWPLWVTAAQLSATITHFAPLTAADGAVKLYQVAQPAWMFVVLTGIAWGALSTRSRPQDEN